MERVTDGRAGRLHCCNSSRRSSPSPPPCFLTTATVFVRAEALTKPSKQPASMWRRVTHWCVGLDLEKFFDRVNHDILMANVQRQVEDKRVLGLIRRYL